MNGNGAIVLHSGGQDSSTCLAWAAERWERENVYPVSFWYDQKHQVEIECAQRICEYFGVAQPYLIMVEALAQLGGTALTDAGKVEVALDASGGGNLFAEQHGLPSTFIPGRNLLFLTLAAAYGAKMGIYNLVTGVCETDAAGYPDCREVFVDAAQDAIRRALDDEQVTIHAPLLHRSKAATFKLAEELQCVDAIVRYTHTCYHGEHQTLHEWGYGCGECPACDERRKGWESYRGGDRDRVHLTD